MKLPIWLKYTDKVEGGDSFMFRIRINPKYQDDKGLLAHEVEHVRQWYFCTAFSFLCILLGFTLFKLTGAGVLFLSLM